MSKLPQRVEEKWIEQLADIEHQRWADWQAHCHKKVLDGGGVFPDDLLDRWERQINTPYVQLSEKEKESDREQVRRYLPVIATILDEEKQKIVKSIKDYLLREHIHFSSNQEENFEFQDEHPYIESLSFERYIVKKLLI